MPVSPHQSGMTGMRVFAAITALALSFSLPGNAYAQKTTDRSKQKKIAETERADLRQKLNTLKRSIDKTLSLIHI